MLGTGSKCYRSSLGLGCSGEFPQRKEYSSENVKKELQRTRVLQAGGRACKVFIGWKYREFAFYGLVGTADFLE